MDASKLKFDYKALAGLVMLVSMWYDLKTDFAVHKEEHKLVDYRIASLERCTGCEAIMPKEIKIERKQ